MTFILSEYKTKTDNSNLPLTTVEVNNHLKESFSDISTEVYLSALIKAVQKFGEQFTRREFLTKTFINYRNEWKNGYELRRSKYQSIVSVKYIDENEDTQTVSSENYAITDSEEYSYLYFKDDFDYPSLVSDNPQSIIIEFSAGYGIDESYIPDNIKTAMLHHLARLWAQRGDCPDEGKGFDSIIAQALPPEAKLLYSMEQIIDVII